MSQELTTELQGEPYLPKENTFIRKVFPSLKNIDIHYIRNSGLPTKELAVKYGQSEVNINRIKRLK